MYRFGIPFQEEPSPTPLGNCGFPRRSLSWQSPPRGPSVSLSTPCSALCHRCPHPALLKVCPGSERPQPRARPHPRTALLPLLPSPPPSRLPVPSWEDRGQRHLRSRSLPHRSRGQKVSLDISPSPPHSLTQPLLAMGRSPPSPLPYRGTTPPALLLPLLLTQPRCRWPSWPLGTALAHGQPAAS